VRESVGFEVGPTIASWKRRLALMNRSELGALDALSVAARAARIASF
jgi:hypothetical protein